MKSLKLISWNVNGIRAAVRHGFVDFLQKYKPDVLCLQEIKINELARAKETFDFAGYEEYWNHAERPGYAGTAFLVKDDLVSQVVSYVEGVGSKLFDAEGRVQTLEFEKFYLVNTYFPHTRHDLSRLPFKLAFNLAVEKHIKKLDKKKPAILTGDLNVAHQDIDLANPKTNEKNPGFLPEERQWMSKFLAAGFVDTFRSLHPRKVQYTWWSWRFNARERNIGWRIDYFCASTRLVDKIQSATILDEVKGSDHCPVSIQLEK